MLTALVIAVAVFERVVPVVFNVVTGVCEVEATSGAASCVSERQHASSREENNIQVL